MDIDATQADMRRALTEIRSLKSKYVHELNTNRTYINMLLDDLKRRRENDVAMFEESAALVVGFMSKVHDDASIGCLLGVCANALPAQAFAIFVASEFQQLFVHSVGGFIFGLPLNKWSTLWGYSIWLVIAYSIDPLTKHCLSKFNNNGNRSRTYLEDYAQCVKESIPVMVLWSYKVAWA